MKTTIRDILNLIGGELKDDIDATSRFRNFISQEKWETDQYKEWLDECIKEGKGSHDPYNRAFQDLVVTVGRKLGFDVKYGKYQVRRGEEAGFDGLWERDTEEAIVLEVKTTTWPLGDIDQLGKYIDSLRKSKANENVYGLYIIGGGDVKPLIQQIHGSKYRDSMRIIQYEDLIELLHLKEELEPVIGEKDAVVKSQSLLFPVESINVGNVLKLILEIATARSTAKEEVEEEEKAEEAVETEDLPWTKGELTDYLNECTSYQRVLLAALIQAEEEPTLKKKVLYLMTQIAEKKPGEGIKKKITGLSIAGARAGLKMRRKNLKKEDIIDSKWDESVRELTYRIKPEYKSAVEEWVKKEGLML